MAVELADIDWMLKLRSRKPEIFSGKSALILGDCRFWVSPGHLSRLTGVSLSEKNLEWCDLSSFRDAWGFSSLETIDLSGEPTIRWDLHEPVPSDWESKFDWVFDFGTLYCCFDVPAVFRNITRLLKVGGNVLHTSALSGHYGRCGLYNIHPETFQQFYAFNGFEIVSQSTRVKPSFLLSGRVRPIWAWFKKFGWQQMSHRARFLRAASRAEVQFSEVQILPEPEQIPSNALLLTHATKTSTVPYKAIIANVYSKS